MTMLPLAGDPHAIRTQRKRWQAEVRVACNKLAAAHNAWQAGLLAGRRALVDFAAARAGIQSLHADMQGCWGTAVNVDASPVFASLPLTDIGKLFYRVRRACAVDLHALGCVASSLVPECLDEQKPSASLHDVEPIRQGLEGPLLVWSTDLEVADAVEALQGALHEDTRGF
ncbi:hypothetical protein WJX81_001355 [Elliptochloris bilobata]|uniref:Uncharacterized protein n=1 Tax=Elliptochloris bilobata TaxID=381761 RepID=A0AAW1RTS4_9CHLO